MDFGIVTPPFWGDTCNDDKNIVGYIWDPHFWKLLIAWNKGMHLPS